METPQLCWTLAFVPMTIIQHGNTAAMLDISLCANDHYSAWKHCSCAGDQSVPMTIIQHGNTAAVLDTSLCANDHYSAWKHCSCAGHYLCVNDHYSAWKLQLFWRPSFVSMTIIQHGNTAAVLDTSLCQ